MTYKILALVIPLTISSVANLPMKISFDAPKARISSKSSSRFSFIPIDSSSTSSSEPVGTDYFDCRTFGPFNLSTVTNSVPITFTYELYSIASQSIVERVRLLNSSNSVVASISQPYFYYSVGTRKSVNFSLPIRDNLTRNGLTLKFELVNASTYAIVKTYSATFYPSSDSYINWTTLKQEPYTSKSLGFYSKDDDIEPLIEVLDFTSFGDYLDVDYYYRLDLSKNVITYPNDCAFRYTNAYLSFNDSADLFPYLDHQSSGDIYLPLTMTKENEKITFKFKNTFYINKRTLQMSNTYRAGFVSTKDFYLPVNGRMKFNGKQLYYVLEGIGIDNISTSFPIKYDVSTSLVGLCTDGDYCVVGGSR